MQIPTTVLGLIAACPAGQLTGSDTVTQLLILQAPFNLGGPPFTTQCPVCGGGETRQVSIAELRTVPPLPMAAAVTVIGPPTATQVAIPVLGSIVATLESEEDQFAGKFGCVVGAESKVPVALNGTVPLGTNAAASFGCTDKATN
jgi:hypothetical protein